MFRREANTASAVSMIFFPCAFCQLDVNWDIASAVLRDEPAVYYTRSRRRFYRAEFLLRQIFPERAAFECSLKRNAERVSRTSLDVTTRSALRTGSLLENFV